MKHFILGTAGHVDHGKSTLIKALTSVDTDRLPEEKERGLSIDLGFAPLQLAGKQPIQLGIVDVPGHQRFLRNMIAGVGGFDACLLVVDCLEGVKPQTREHLKILELLETRSGVVALTKVDRADEEAVEIATWELKELLSSTFLKNAPIVAVSGLTGEGLEELKAALYRMFENLPERSPLGVARLPVDRAFSKTGFGDVATGSLWSGVLKVGQDVEVLPAGVKGKVRGLQVHGRPTDEALPGQRVAANVSGLAEAVLARGQTLVSPPGALQVGDRFAVELKLLQPEPNFLHKKRKATFFQATGHHQIAINLVAEKDSDLTVFGQLHFPEPVLLCRGDRFLLRDESDTRLLAGGRVLSPESAPFRRGRAGEHLSRYQALAGGGEVGRVVGFLREKNGQVREKELRKHLGVSGPEWEHLLDEVLDLGEVRRVGKDRLWLTEDHTRLRAQVEDLLQKLAAAAPWKAGWKAADLSSLLGRKSGKDDGFDELLEDLHQSKAIQRRGPLFSPAGHTPVLQPESQARAEAILRRLSAGGCSPPDWVEVVGELAQNKKEAEQLEEYLLGTQRVVRLAEKLVFAPAALEEARERLSAAHPDGFTASDARLTLETSRKYIIPILEWMDQQGWTVRLGDIRKLSS